MITFCIIKLLNFVKLSYFLKTDSLYKLLIDEGDCMILCNIYILCNVFNILDINPFVQNNEQFSMVHYNRDVLLKPKGVVKSSRDIFVFVSRYFPS
ncbi:unnamed protein product [Larinioides sclopetarius]|uniref:Uncharacterized protein n=1 Tax=Larinioides sclopetarius TaxID=280406 RepID=A0AAV1ZNK2_9ARAC